MRYLWVSTIEASAFSQTLNLCISRFPCIIDSNAAVGVYGYVTHNHSGPVLVSRTGNGGFNPKLNYGAKVYRYI